ALTAPRPRGEAPPRVMDPHRPCPVCGARRARALHRRPARRILRCACGLVFIDPLPSEAEVAAREAEAFRGELLAETRAMLDVGVGTGLLVHLARQAGWDATGVDICAEAAERAGREFGVAVAVGDFLAVDLPGGYHAITMADVVEHSRDPRAFLARAHALLAPGGVLYVGVPNHRSLVYLAGDVLGWLPGTGGLVDRQPRSEEHTSELQS